jgi:Fe-S cluster assembly scaffold protein SufB
LGFLEPGRFTPGVLTNVTPGAFLENDRAAERAGDLLSLGTAFQSRLSPEAQAQGVVFCDLAEALVRCPEKVTPHLGRVVPAASGKFAAMNTAYFESGVFLHVPRGVSVSLPFLGGFGAGVSKGRALFPRTLVVLEEGAQATYIEDLTAAPSEGENLSSAVVEISLAAGARLQYIHLQRWPAGWWHF